MTKGIKTPATVKRQIRALYRNGMSQKAIASRLGIGQRTVYGLTRNVIRKNVPKGVTLPSSTVKKITILFKAGLGSTYISKVFGLSLQTIWKHTKGILPNLRPCAECGKGFYPVRGWNRFCCTSHKNKFNGRMYRGKHTWGSMYIAYVICPICGAGGSLVGKTRNYVEIVGFVMRHRMRNGKKKPIKWECWIC